MFANMPAQSRRIGQIGWSVALHAVVLTLLLHTFRPIRVRPSLPGNASGTRIELTYLPGRDSVSTPVKEKPAKVAAFRSKPTPVPLSAPAQLQAPEIAAPSTGQGAPSGNDALGTEDIQIALTTYSPSPKPDLSHMPAGLQGDVVLDVTIDPTGKVADLQILHALGYGVESNVADIVRTWKFRPAMKDGVPVASVQELHFHYGPV